MKELPKWKIKELQQIVPEKYKDYYALIDFIEELITEYYQEGVNDTKKSMKENFARFINGEFVIKGTIL